MRLECPICGKSEESQERTTWPEFPFCSPRCRLIDLGRWLREDYRVPVEEEKEDPTTGL